MTENAGGLVQLNPGSTVPPNTHFILPLGHLTKTFVYVSAQDSTDIMISTVSSVSPFCTNFEALLLSTQRAELFNLVEMCFVNPDLQLLIR